MAHQKIFLALKEFHQTGKFTLLKNHVVSLETLSTSALCQERLFLTHSQEVERLLLQLVSLTEGELGLKRILVSTVTLLDDLSREKHKTIADEVNETIQKHGDFC